MVAHNGLCPTHRAEVMQLQGAWADALDEARLAAAIRRAVGETMAPLKRAALLPAYVEIMLDAGDVETARSAARQLGEVAEPQGSDALQAMSAHARGTVALADGDPNAALVAARGAAEKWQELRAPYENAQARVLVGMACHMLGDEDSAALELDAAQNVFARLGAVRDLAGIDSLIPSAEIPDAHGLTARELEVLRLVAVGKTNREIASALVISERTVARHLQIIFAKLRASSRTEASAFAHEHDLL
jgi:DNA-binding NarL/FixJ family response regulator